MNDDPNDLVSIIYLDSLDDYAKEIDRILLSLNLIEPTAETPVSKQRCSVLRGLPPLHPNPPSYYNRKKTKTSKKFINGIAFIKKNIK